MQIPSITNRLTPRLPLPLEQLWIRYLRPGEVYMLTTVHAGTLLDEQKSDTNTTLEDLVKDGDEKTLQLFLQQEPKLTWAKVLLKAAGGGHVNVMELCWTKGANNIDNWGWAHWRAAQEGHHEAVELCATKGANDTDVWKRAQAIRKRLERMRMLM
jgi:hypothetical protein